MTMELWILSVLLLLLAIVFVALELFIPSGGVLGFLAVSAIIAAVVVAFLHSMTFGTIMVAITAVLVPVSIAIALQVWPYTPIGRRVLIGRPTSDEVLPNTEEYHVLQGLIDHYGTAKHEMLPSGIVEIDGREYDAVSAGMPISAGQPVRVVAVQANHIVVRPTSRVESRLPDSKRSEEDILSRPLDALGLDPFDDPLA